MEEEAARDAVQKGWIRIGWSRCRVSKYEARYKCFQCGGIGHTRVQCKSQEKLCYKCGSPGHDAKECKEKEVVEERRGVPVEGRREAMEEMIAKEIGNMRRQLGIRMEETNAETSIGKKGTRTIGTQTEERGGEGTWAQRVGQGVMQGRRQAIVQKEVGKREGDIKNRKSAAVLVRTEKRYEEAIKELKEKIGSPGKTNIKSVRKTRTGGILFEIDDPEEARKWGNHIEREMGNEVKVTQLREREGIRIRGIEGTVEKEEIIKCIIQAGRLDEEEGKQVEVVRLIVEPWMDKTALVKLPRKVAEELCETGKLRIGWTIGRVTRMPRLMVRCWKCGRNGHGSMECRKDEGVTQMDKAIEEALRDIRGLERVEKGGSEEKGEKGREKCEEVRGTQLQKEDWTTVRKKSRQNTA
ncbi:hypothetical protein WH47_01314 [Habropoda laboriosa]|uniref:CCHC-type domain-containing protein n=1 Tax=Habropoda laboriosa TaxID=597456 RepID=A0A0L7QJY4_9HYME|nr:hypothetical protein WH47_01314 [Habropoda laboriosa]